MRLQAVNEAGYIIRDKAVDAGTGPDLFFMITYFFMKEQRTCQIYQTEQTRSTDNGHDRTVLDTAIYINEKKNIDHLTFYIFKTAEAGFCLSRAPFVNLCYTI